jgi:hypothetical protein
LRWHRFRNVSWVGAKRHPPPRTPSPFDLSLFSLLSLCQFTSRYSSLRHTAIAHGVPFHTQLRLNASLRIGTSVAVEHCATRLTDSLTDSPGCRWPFKPPPCQCCRCAAVGSPMCRMRTQLARPQCMPPRLLPLAPLSASALSVVSLSKLITRAALSARRLSRRGLGLSLCRRVKFTTALPLGV